MAPKTILEDLTDLAVSVDSATPSECQPSYVEGPPLDEAGSWGQRCERLLRRLDQGMQGSPLAERSAWAVVQGLQRARAMSDEFGDPCSLACEGEDSGDVLMATGRGGSEDGAENGAGRRIARKVERLAGADKGEV